MVTAKSAAPLIAVQGDRIISMLAEDVKTGAKPVTDFRGVKLPRVLEDILEDIAVEFLYRNERRSSSAVAGGGGGQEKAATYEKVFDRVRREFTEYVPINARSKRACLEKFKDLKYLGSGKFGDVFDVSYVGAASAPSPAGYRYALKTVALNPSMNPSAYENVVSEVRIARLMGKIGVGPAVHEVYWCRQSGGYVVMMVMDYMSRGDLQKFSKNRAVTEDHARAIRKKLRKMHAAGYLHNDIHPGNILVNEKPSGGFEFFIADFGMSKQIDAGASSKALVKAELASLQSLRMIVTRDALRGLLYAMVQSGRIQTDVVFDQSATSACDSGYSSSTNDPDSSGVTAGVESARHGKKKKDS